MEFIIETILTLVALAAMASYFKYDTTSPKLIVQTMSSWFGYSMGSTPVALKTAKLAVTAANLKAEKAIKESGEGSPLAFRAARLNGHKDMTEYTADIDKDNKETIATLNVWLSNNSKQ